MENEKIETPPHLDVIRIQIRSLKPNESISKEIKECLMK